MAARDAEHGGGGAARKRLAEGVAEEGGAEELLAPGLHGRSRRQFLRRVSDEAGEFFVDERGEGMWAGALAVLACEVFRQAEVLGSETGWCGGRSEDVVFFEGFCNEGLGVAGLETLLGQLELRWRRRRRGCADGFDAPLHGYDFNQACIEDLLEGGAIQFSVDGLTTILEALGYYGKFPECKCLDISQTQFRCLQHL